MVCLFPFEGMALLFLSMHLYYSNRALEINKRKIKDSLEVIGGVTTQMQRSCNETLIRFGDNCDML